MAPWSVLLGAQSTYGVSQGGESCAGYENSKMFAKCEHADNFTLPHCVVPQHISSAVHSIITEETKIIIIRQ